MVTMKNRCRMIIALWIGLFVTEAAGAGGAGDSVFHDGANILIPLGLKTNGQVDMNAKQQLFTLYSQHCSDDQKEYVPHRDIPLKNGSDLPENKGETIPKEQCVMTMNEMVDGSAGFTLSDPTCRLTIECSELAADATTGLIEFCKKAQLFLAKDGKNVRAIESPTCSTSGHTGKEKLLKRFRHTATKISTYYKQGTHTDNDNLQLNTKPFFYKDQVYSHYNNVEDYSGFQSEQTPEGKATSGQQRHIVASNKILCGMGCEGGRVYSFVPDRANTFVADMFVTKQCSWIDICIDAKMADDKLYCDANKKLKVHLKANFAVAMWSKPGIPIRFFRKDEPYTRISLAKSVTGVISLTSGLGERALFQPYSHSDETIGIVFSSKECLKENYGMRMSAPIDAYDYIGEDGKLQSVKDTVKSVDFHEAGTFTSVTVVIAGAASGGTQKIKYVEPVLAALPEATTAKSLDPADAIGYGQAPIDLSSQLRRKRGWMTWAIFFGCVVGSSVGFLTLSVLFYFLRRTVYDDWYRGMYKRYQCDASGTTGGITGAEFGATTMGGTSASQMSTVAGGGNTATGGGTTALDTTGGGGGTTAGGTTGGDTVGL